MKRVLSILLCAVLVLPLLTSCASQQSPQASLSAADLLDLGEKYLLELNYEQALVQFLKVIDVEPMNPRGYIGAAESHVGLGQLVDSISVVQSGMKAIQDIEAKQPLFEWLDGFGDDMFAGENFIISAIAYEKLLEENLQAAYAYKLAQSHLASGDVEKAIAVLRDMAEQLDDDEMRWEADMLDELVRDGQPAGIIRIVDVLPRYAPVGQETTFEVTVRYASANADGCIIYAGANTDDSERYRLFDEYILPNTYGVYTFQFSCVPAHWPDEAFGIYVNISAYPHPDSWSPFGSDVFDLDGNDVDASVGAENGESGNSSVAGLASNQDGYKMTPEVLSIMRQLLLAFREGDKQAALTMQHSPALLAWADDWPSDLKNVNYKEEYDYYNWMYSSDYDGWGWMPGDYKMLQYSSDGFRIRLQLGSEGLGFNSEESRKCIRGDFVECISVDDSTPKNGPYIITRTDSYDFDEQIDSASWEKLTNQDRQVTGLYEGWFFYGPSMQWNDYRYQRGTTIDGHYQGEVTEELYDEGRVQRSDKLIFDDGYQISPVPEQEWKRNQQSPFTTGGWLG